MNTTDLGLLTPRQLINKFNGYTERRNMDRAFDRLHTLFITQSNGAKVKAGRDLYEIAGLDDKVRPYMEEDELDDLLNKWGRTIGGAKVMNKKELLKLRQNPS